MSSSGGHHLNLESQNIVQILIEKLHLLKTSNNFSDEINLFTKACFETNIQLDKFFTEDISNIYLFSCQIIINKNICLVAASGATKDESFKKSVQKFIEYSFRQNRNNGNRILTSDIYEYCSVDKALENHNYITDVDEFINFCKDFLFRSGFKKEMKVNYNNIKRGLTSNGKSKRFLSESYWVDEGNVRCYIFLNGNLLLQQGLGESEEQSFENAISEMFDAYEIKPETINTENSPMDESWILEQMALKFEENQTHSTNYWEIIHKCAEELQFSIQLQFYDDSCSVKINGIKVLESSGSSEYSATIEACKDLLNIFRKTLRTRNIEQQKALTRMTKQDDYSSEKEDIIKKVMCNVRTILESTPTNNFWTTVNQEFLKQNLKLELTYGEANQKLFCNFNFQNWKVISGEGINRPSAREDAANKLVKKYS